MIQNLVDDNMPVANRAYLIITIVFHGPDTLNEEHAHNKYILLACNIVENHKY